MEPKVMTAQEAAEVLNVSLSTIYNLRDRGTLPQLTKLPGVRFAAKDVLALVGEQIWEYTPQRMKDLQRELERKDARIKTLEGLLRGASLIAAGLITAGAIWGERTKPEPSDYLTFEHVVYTGDSLWSLCERYGDYEDIQTIIMRVREENGIDNPGSLQPGQKIKVRVRKGNR